MRQGGCFARQVQDRSLGQILFEISGSLAQLSQRYRHPGPRRVASVQMMIRAVVLFVFGGAIAVAQTRPSAPEALSVAANPSALARTGDRAGLDRCRACHKSEVRQFVKTRHAEVAAARSGPGMDCETCHGPGKAHADAEEAAHGDDAKTAAANKLIFAFRSNPKQAAERCQQCHQSSRDQAQSGHSTHSNHGVACSSWHAMQLTEPVAAVARRQASVLTGTKLPEETAWLRGSLLKQAQPTLCYGCHGNIQAQFTLPTHRRVPEGAMKCTDCHNTHGTSNRAML